MADFSVLKGLNESKKFGNAPINDGKATNLEAPETAPLEVSRKSREKTNRTVQFATRVSPDFDAEFRLIAFKNKLKLTELLEECLEAYKENNKA